MILPPVPNVGQLVCGYDLDANRVLIPQYVLDMPARKRKAWMTKNHIVPAVSGAAYSMFEMMQPFMAADAVTVSVVNVETIATQDALLTLPANFFSFPGKVLWFHAAGKQSNVVTTPGTVKFQLRYNGVAGTSLVASGLCAPDPVAATDNVWFLDIYVKCVAITAGTTPTITLLSYGEIEMANDAGTLASGKARTMPPGQVALANVTGLDGTLPKALTLTVQPTLSTLTVTCRDAWIVALN